jgi:hypothetical protein
MAMQRSRIEIQSRMLRKVDARPATLQKIERALVAAHFEFIDENVSDRGCDLRKRQRPKKQKKS